MASEEINSVIKQDILIKDTCPDIAMQCTQDISLDSPQKDSLLSQEDDDCQAALISDEKQVDDATNGSEVNDPYSYLKRGDYTSENYKLELFNLPKRFGIAQLKKKLLFYNLKPCKVKMVDRGHYAFVTFQNEVERDRATTVLQGLVWKNKAIKVKMANASADPLILKRKRISDDVESEQKPKVQALSDCSKSSDVTPSERLNNTVSPLWKMPYIQQLELKVATITKFLKQLGQEIEKNNDSNRDWFKCQRSANSGLCCTLLPIESSPVINNYRNKCEFTIGRSSDGTDKVVGFRLGSYKDGDLSVLEPTDCTHISSLMKDIAMKLQTYVQTKSTRSSFNPITRQGYWQTAVVRTTSCGHSMLVVVIHPQQLTQVEIEDERNSLQQYFSSVVAQDLSLSSLYLQVSSDRQMEGTSSCDLLLGEKYIEETLLQMKFQISPSAFFQVNTAAAEKLYTLIAEMCGNPSVLLDVCCGTGTIGLTMANRAKTVIGIDICEEAIQDAKRNASINSVSNADFLCGRVEDILPNVLWRVAGQEVVMVVDPPRAGLHSSVVRVIRRNSAIQRLVYVSCKPSAAKPNIVDFTRDASKRVTGAPFRLKKAIPVDLFPHTEHCELIMLLERTSE